METMKYGGSVNKPPILYGINYDYWKMMMVSFLKSLGSKAWKVVLKGWKHPIITAEDGATSLKPEADWTGAQDEEALGNSKALNVIFNSVERTCLGWSTHVQKLEKLERFSKLLMKAHPKFVCQGNNSLPPSLRT